MTSTHKDIMMHILSDIKKHNGYSKLEDSDILKAIRYFQFFRYLETEFSVGDFENATARLQRQAELPVDGDLTPKTMRALDIPRCGCHENILEANQLGRFSPDLEYINVFISERDSDLSAKVWDEIIIQGLEGIERVCGAQFRQVFSKNQANIVLSIGSGRANQFDGPSGILAWAELAQGPNFKGQVNLKFDKDENWVVSGRGIRLLNIFRHECLHCLGIGHTDVKNQLMSPFYSESIEEPQSAWDIPELVKRYGPPVSTPTPVPTPTPPGDEMVIKLRGNIQSIDVSGYRVQKIS